MIPLIGLLIYQMIATSRRRGWLQFSLRTLLLLTAIAAISVYVWEQNRPRRELDEFAAEALKFGGQVIRSNGGRIGRDGEGIVWACSFIGAPLTDAEFAYLANLPGAKRLRSMRLQSTRITDWRNLRGFTSLTSLLLWDCSISDDTLVELEQLPQLRHVSIEWIASVPPPITENAIAKLTSKRPDIEVASSFDHLYEGEQRHDPSQDPEEQTEHRSEERG